MKKQTKYSAAFNAQVVKEMLKEEKSYSQISSEFKVHTTQLNRRKTTLVEAMPTLFEKNKKDEEEKKELQEKVQKLYGEIARLTTLMNWLKKIWNPNSVANNGKR